MESNFLIEGSEAAILKRKSQIDKCLHHKSNFQQYIN